MARSLALAGFLCAGLFKADERLAWLPVDLTLLLAGISLLLAADRIVRSGFRLPAVSLLGCVALFAVLAIPTLWTTWTPEAVDKVARLFSLTFLATILPLLLFRTRADVLWFLNTLTLLGMVIAVDGAVTWMTVSGLHRLESWNASTIAIGRAAGVAILWVAIRGIERRQSLVATLILLAPLVAVLYASGSRGPLLTVAAVLILSGALFYMRTRGNLVRYTLIGVVGFLFLMGSVSVAPDWSAMRIQRLLHGELGLSEQVRLEAYSGSLAEIARNPRGIGWGAFTEYVHVPVPEEPYQLRYPHNLIVELFLECGWVVGTAFVGMLVLMLGWAYRSARTSLFPEERGVFALAVFALANAMVSGDVNDARELFALLGLIVACGTLGMTRRQHATGVTR